MHHPDLARRPEDLPEILGKSIFDSAGYLRLGSVSHHPYGIIGNIGVVQKGHPRRFGELRNRRCSDGRRELKSRKHDHHLCDDGPGRALELQRLALDIPVGRSPNTDGLPDRYSDGNEPYAQQEDEDKDGPETHFLVVDSAQPKKNQGDREIHHQAENPIRDRQGIFAAPVPGDEIGVCRFGGDRLRVHRSGLAADLPRRKDVLDRAHQEEQKRRNEERSGRTIDILELVTAPGMKRLSAPLENDIRCKEHDSQHQAVECPTSLHAFALVQVRGSVEGIEHLGNGLPVLKAFPPHQNVIEIRKACEFLSQPRRSERAKLIPQIPQIPLDRHRLPRNAPARRIIDDRGQARNGEISRRARRAYRVGTSGIFSETPPNTTVRRRPHSEPIRRSQRAAPACSASSPRKSPRPLADRTSTCGLPRSSRHPAPPRRALAPSATPPAIRTLRRHPAAHGHTPAAGHRSRASAAAIAAAHGRSLGVRH